MGCAVLSYGSDTCTARSKTIGRSPGPSCTEKAVHSVLLGRRRMGCARTFTRSPCQLLLAFFPVFLRVLVLTLGGIALTFGGSDVVALNAFQQPNAFLSTALAHASHCATFARRMCSRIPLSPGVLDPLSHSVGTCGL
eukprot:3324503-Rhodomonas_salina.7